MDPTVHPEAVVEEEPVVIGEVVERRGPSGCEELSEGGLGQIQTQAAARGYRAGQSCVSRSERIS